jgi:mannosyl-3-phosphoglycerate phosphatase
MNPRRGADHGKFGATGFLNLARRLHLLTSTQLQEPDSMNWLVVTDLDGTLLDATYPVAQAAAAIDAIAGGRRGVPVVLASSKTLSEMVSIAGRCESNPVLLFENGAGMAWREPALGSRGTFEHAGFQVECTAVPYADICARLELLRRDRAYQFRGFADMTSAELAALTGLELAAAEAAQRRMASEPIEWCGDDESLQRFRQELADMGLCLERGGVFRHVTGNINKQRALLCLINRMRYQTGVRFTTLACGDAPNDLAMLKAADNALVFPHVDGGYLLPEGDGVRHAPKAGPATWLAYVSQVIESAGVEALTI